MKRQWVLLISVGLLLFLSHDVEAGGSRGGSRTRVQRHWRSAAPQGQYYPFSYRRYYPYYPYRYSYFRNDPRSIIIITPHQFYPYYAPGAVITSEPFYCHMHYVGFVSRAGFLDHISGTHKIPLKTADQICAEGEESCWVEGY
jgi:hypothetical protein